MDAAVTNKIKIYLIYLALIDQNLLSPFLLTSDSKIKEHESIVF